MCVCVSAWNPVTTSFQNFFETQKGIAKRTIHAQLHSSEIQLHLQLHL